MHGRTHIQLAVLTTGQFLCQTISVVSQYFTTWKRKPLAILHTVYRLLWCDAITMVIDGSFAKRWHQSSHGDDYCLPWRPIHCQVCCSIDRFNLNPESLIKSVGSWDRECEVDFQNTRYVINCKLARWPVGHKTRALKMGEMGHEEPTRPGISPVRDPKKKQKMCPNRAL